MSFFLFPLKDQRKNICAYYVGVQQGSILELHGPIKLHNIFASLELDMVGLLFLLSQYS